MGRKESTNGRQLNCPAKRLALSLQHIKNELCDVLSAASQPAADRDHKTCSKVVSAGLLLRVIDVFIRKA